MTPAAPENARKNRIYPQTQKFVNSFGLKKDEIW
jgi:hypothetical protein